MCQRCGPAEPTVKRCKYVPEVAENVAMLARIQSLHEQWVDRARGKRCGASADAGKIKELFIRGLTSHSPLGGQRENVGFR